MQDVSASGKFLPDNAGFSLSQVSRDLSGAKSAKRIEETSRDFEAMFVSEMMKPMFEGISTEAPFGGGKGEEVFRGFLLQEYGKMVAQTGGIGIADQVQQQMIRLQEEQNHAGHQSGQGRE